MLKVGEVVLPNRILLAPMEAVTNIAYRRIVREIAKPGLVYSEFVSAMANKYAPDRSHKKMTVHADEHPIAIQIFGGDPTTMAAIARSAEELGADIIDINMGCWVPKVCRTGAGAALLKDPVLAKQIVLSVVKAVKIPVTVKVRAGWSFGLFAAPELVRSFQDVGAQAITLHARFATQGFEGVADWKLIEQIRKSVSVPLFGNGDIKTPNDARNMMDLTGCDAVMIGRVAISNPWILRDMVRFLNGQQAIPITLADRVNVALRHIRYMIEHETSPNEDISCAEARACRALRGQIPLYLKGFDGAADLRKSLQQCQTYADYEGILRPYSDKFSDNHSALSPMQP